jgi:hypothetical protein
MYLTETGQLLQIVCVFEQDGAANKKMAVEGRSDFEDSGSDNGKTCSGFSNNMADGIYQNLSSTDLRTVQFARNEGMPEDTQFAAGHRQLLDRVPEICNLEVPCREGGSSQIVENVQAHAVFMGNVANCEVGAGKRVGETSGLRLRVKPEYNERTGTLWKPFSGEAEKENILGIQLQPLSLERVGSLKW